MIRILLVLFGAALLAPPAAMAASQCTVPSLSLDDSNAAFARAFAPESAQLAELKANFAAAFASACAKGLLKADQPAIALINAPSANIASIYQQEDGRRVLEYPFVTEDGQTHIPPAEEIEEAVYCAVKGATLEEQETSGRCLPD